MRFLSLFIRSFSSSSAASSSASLRKGDVVVLSAARTPIGAFGGSLSSLSAVQLGGTAISAAIQRSGIDKKDISEVIMGNVVSAGLGQAPATQAATAAGIPNTVPSWSLNKVCSSGLKAFQIAAANIRSSDQSLVVAGGFESMSNIPFYSARPRSAFPYGHQELIDGIAKDGLTDAYEPYRLMGNCAEKCAAEYKITRQDQDAYALESYRRAVAAQKAGLFTNEIVPVIIKGRAGEVSVKDDEEPGKLKADKVPTLRPAFDKNGTVTAANASKINDGAAAFVLADGEFALSHGLKPIARVLSWADAQQAPVDFTTAPSIAIPMALKKAGLTLKDIDYFEINEAFSVVAIANNRILGLDPSRVNVNGGAVALGHPIGGSGARIMVTLLHVLQQKGGKYGVAAICNGGGGATAVIVERL